LEALPLSILVRPVREQLEHDRLIRLLQVKLRRKFDAGINPGAEQNVPVGAGASAVYPDLVLWSLDRGRRLQCGDGRRCASLVRGQSRQRERDLELQQHRRPGPIHACAQESRDGAVPGKPFRIDATGPRRAAGRSPKREEAGQARKESQESQAGENRQESQEAQQTHSGAEAKIAILCPS
jgi:hypothetical protein